MSGLSISELELHTLPQLIEVYRTIDKESNPIKISVIEKQIRIKMKLSASADLSSESIQKEFDQILSDYAPIKLINDKNKTIVSKLRKVQNLSLLVMVIILVFSFIYKDFINRSTIYLLAAFGTFAIIEVVQSRYSGLIAAGAITIEEGINPQLFGCMQAFLLIFGIAMLFLLLVMI